MKKILIGLVALQLLFTGMVNAKASLEYEIEYHTKLIPEKKGFQVIMDVKNSHLLKRVVFQNKNKHFANLSANGKLIERDEEVEWILPANTARLSYFVSITHGKGDGRFDAYYSDNWAVFRGDDLVPAFHTYEEEGAYSKSRLVFGLPDGWSVESAWKKIAPTEFEIDNPERRFDRPVGWFVIGKIGTRQAKVAGTSLVVASPKGSGMQRMEALTFFSFVWPEIKKTFGTVPDKLLILGAPDPMWRGGLSASNSLYLHVDRPLVSENGTSPLFHELTHMITRISGVETDKANDDWIAEGLAEYYSFELLYKAGGISKARKTKILKKLADWGKDVKHLRKSKSTGPVTARAVVLFAELDEEIRSQSKHDLGDVTRILMKKRKVSLEDLKAAVESLIGKPSKTLQSPLLR